MKVWPSFIFLGLLLLGGLTGCSHTKPLAVWRAELEDRLDSDGSSASIYTLADQRSPRQPRPGRITFSVLDVSSRRGNCDVRGELVDVVDVAGKPWDVFLVGTLSVDGGRTRELVDLRPVATRADKVGRSWLVGEADDAPLTAYREARGVHAIAAHGFPMPTDRFRAESSDESIIVTDHDSDARWTLSASDPRH